MQKGKLNPCATTAKPGLAIIVPVLNEAEGLADLIAHLQSLKVDQLIVVDGGSTDGTVERLNRLAHDITIVDVPAGRARQMNAGSAVAEFDTLLFLHADTRLPNGFGDAVMRAPSWGRFDVVFDDPGLAMRVIAFCMNWRSRLTGIATGDQAIFVKRSVFELVGGFPDIPLMEDVAISRHLKQQAAPYCSKLRVRTSARRWQQYGVIRTVLLMWWFRFAYWLGASPQSLRRQYDDVR